MPATLSEGATFKNVDFFLSREQNDRRLYASAHDHLGSNQPVRGSMVHDLNEQVKKEEVAERDCLFSA